MNIVYFFLLLAFCHDFRVESKKILFLNPPYIVSNEENLFIMGDILAQKGHEVTMYRLSHRSLITAASDKYLIRNLKVNESLFKHEYIKNGIITIPHEYGWDVNSMTFFGISHEFLTLSQSNCKMLSGTPLFDEIKEAKYDLAIVHLIENACSLAVTQILNIPTIGVWSNAQAGFHLLDVGIQELPSIVPLCLTSLTSSMDLYDRIVNFKSFLESSFFISSWNIFVDQSMKELFPGFLGYRKTLNNLILMLATTNSIVEPPRPVTRNVISLGCLTCKEAKRLTGVYKKFYDAPDNNGTIVISFGASFFKVDVVPKNLISSLHHLASHIGMKIVIRFKSDYFDDLPNVLAVKYMPQQDLLGHPKTKLFISHCGIKGLMESINSGVPILCIPTFFDQGDNAARATYLGIGEHRVITDVTPEILLSMARSMLAPENYAKYKEKAVRYSRISRDTLMTPNETFIDWVEKAINNDLGFLKMKNTPLMFYQYYCLDIIAVLCIPLVVLYYCL